MSIDNDDMRARRGAAGGAAVPAEKRSFSLDRDLAVRAARLGGAAVPAEKRTFSLNREAAVRAARRGVELRRKRAQTKQEDAGFVPTNGSPAA